MLEEHGWNRDLTSIVMIRPFLSAGAVDLSWVCTDKRRCSIAEQDGIA